MNVKGSIYLTGKTTIISVFGEEKWNAFVPKLAAKDNFFSTQIMSITRIPVDKFILFLDELVKEFFNNDMMQYVTFGKVAAQFGLSPDGMYRSYLLTRDTKQFVESVLPKLWATYFDEGVVVGRLENNFVHINITGLQFKHLYFDYLIMGYFQKALKIFGKKSTAKKVKSLTTGDNNICFQFELKDS